ncbi:MurR/RpiR family transcriptional regulator [Corynebacterium sp.]|uniref:MurR/RpiR family transcriptional regulator n=1 Tax=Corynebacterium sp. TaxID=1720 RepID=UPI0025BD9CEE|nr:MurR/RpiR family transcriptional regulator [Corynebacterium sp.]
MNLVERIGDNRVRLTPAEVRVADFMAANPHSVGRHSALRLAGVIGVSDATVVRTVRKLGFDGLDDLRRTLAADLSRSGRMSSSLRDGTVSSLVRGRAVGAETLMRRLDEDDLQRAVDLLSGARRIVVVGFGPSRHIADYAAARCVRAGLRAVGIGATGAGFADEVAVLDTGDVVVLLSYDGTSAEGDVLLARAGELEIPVIQLTEGELSADPRSAVALGIGRGDPELSPSYVPTVAVLEALTVATAARDPERSERAGDVVDRLRRALGR